MYFSLKIKCHVVQYVFLGPLMTSRFNRKERKSFFFPMNIEKEITRMSTVVNNRTTIMSCQVELVTRVDIRIYK